MSSPILAPNGRPARSELAANFTPQPKAYGYGLYATPQSTGTSDHYRPRNNFLGGGLERELNGYQWRELLSYSRQLFAQLGNLGGAIVQKATYAVGEAWKPQYYGTETAWGQRVEEWLAESFYPVADARGQGFDFVTNLFLDSIAQDVDGDAAMILTSSESGFPQVLFVSADRITGNAAEIPDGPFKGAKLVNGCIIGGKGRVIGYRIQNGDRLEDFTDYSTYNCQLLFEPEWQSQRRGIPRVGRVVLDWFDVQDIDAFLKRGVKLDASQGLLHYTESGTADTAATAISDNDAGATDTDLRIERREGGEILYLKANAGEKVESFASDRPHPNTEAFVARIERRGLLAVGWFYELIDPSKIGGASVRLIQDEARASIRYRQKTIRKRAKRAVTYAVALGMKNGFIPRNDSDWWKFDFELPAQLTVDAGYDRQADVEDLKLGLTTKAAVGAKSGRWWEDTDAQRDREFDALLTRAKAHAEKFSLPLEYVLDRLEQRNPNPATMAQETQQNTQKTP
jgi:hypothetical protein